MKVTVITGTGIQGCTYRIKEIFLEALGTGNEITEFYLPKDGPDFCVGCKKCFMESADACPHAAKTQPIWQSMLKADLLVFAYPVYVMRAPGQLKTLLDHFGVHWSVHRPERAMFRKRAVILTQSIGAPNKAAQKDVKTSLTWWGVSKIDCLGMGMMEGVIWEELSEKRKAIVTGKVQRFAAKCKRFGTVRRSLKTKFLFALGRSLQKAVLKKTKRPEDISADAHHWLEQGWVELPEHLKKS